ncbi:bifunctional folylpolyglutamate synthase/dihydrofolate synthase [Anaeromusa acidaminophila]|uniref:bifunctional folylpolyglutamate synthase/dihydrofolate synthase n=1 Tax=Anaeromusa acidaminophila TaxID=81464 RepID=UPI00036C9722|nr:folylpolyglutamate synthase/dihydrofolate synthase family protein [Anaeromusa acidaminophila]
MTYQESIAYLEGLSRFGIRLGLERMQELVIRLGHPEKKYPTIHITGTNGKGSTTACLAAVLREAGFRTGMYTSPHLERYTERMRIDGLEVEESVFADAIEQTAAAAREMERDGLEHPTQFEVLTAAAFVVFAVMKVDYAVIEVGLGGSLDSTNVIDSRVAVITNVTLEHEDRCGSTVREIAEHKAGIIKKNAQVLTAAQGEALEVIRRRAAECGAVVQVLGEEWQAQIQSMSLNGISWRLQQPDGSNWSLQARLVGEHQAYNASLAVMAALALRETAVNQEAVASGLAKACWPGRFEVLRTQPPLVVDGAHNPAGAAVLRRTLDQVFPGDAVLFLLGILKDKDIDGITSILVREQDRVIAVRPLSERAAEAKDLASHFPPHQVEAVQDWGEGVNRLLQLAEQEPQKVACVAGSLYLLGAVRPLLLGKLQNK